MKPDYDADREYADAVEFLKPFCQHAQARGVTLGIEIMRGAGASAPARIRRFATDYFRSCTLFQVSKGHYILIYPKYRNRNDEKQIQSILAAFQDEYRRFHYAYKIVIGK